MVNILITILISMITSLVTVYFQDRISGFLHRNQRKIHYEENSSFPSVIQCNDLNDFYINDLEKKKLPTNYIKISVKSDKFASHELEKSFELSDYYLENFDIEKERSKINSLENCKIIAIENNTDKTFTLIRIIFANHIYFPIEFSGLSAKVVSSGTNMVFALVGYEGDIKKLVLRDQKNFVEYDLLSVATGENSYRKIIPANSSLTKYY